MDPLLYLFATAMLAPFALFLALALVRRSRFRALAERLGGRHEGLNPITPGAIVGEGFRVEAARVQKAYRTEISVRAPQASGRFLLEPGFFRGAPNWRHARVYGSRSERVFLWEVELPALEQPSREQQQQLLAWLPGPAELEELHAPLEAAGVRAIDVADGNLSTTLRGIVSDPERIGPALDAFRRLAAGRGRAARSAA